MTVKYIPVKKEDTYALIKKAQKGDKEARELIVTQNTGLVKNLALKFTGSGYELDDLLQIGFMGLLKAIDRFDTKFDVMFSTYAVPMILGEIKRYIRDDGKIKVSRQLKTDMRNLKNLKEEYYNKHGTWPKLSYLAEKMELPVEKILEILEAAEALTNVESLDLSLIHISYASQIRKFSGEDRSEEEQERGQKLKARRDQLLELAENGMNLQQLENYICYFYDETEYIWDYMQEPVIMVDDPNRVLESLESRDKEIEEDFKTLLERGQAVPSDLKNLSGKADYLKLYERERAYLFTPFQRTIKGVDSLAEIRNAVTKPTLVFNGKMDLLETEIKAYLKQDYKVTIVCANEERAENMKEFLSRAELLSRVWVKQGELTGGIDFPEEKFCYIWDGDIFGTPKKKKRRKKASHEMGQPIRSFADMQQGDYVVHENHGIGKFVGIEQLTVQNVKKDYLKIKYSGQDILYVPVEQMDLVQKYIGADAGAPKLNKLSGSEWKTTKAKAKAAIANMAKELLEVSAARQMEEGYAFSPDTVWQKEFEDTFPYTETEDQLRCIEEIKQDMEKASAMDRLLCGDVGFGKTEVAARAVFKCAADGKQAAVLVPTTILANQHFYTLKERFEKFPFKVEMLSRFRSEAQQKAAIEGLAKGSVDVVIGTHRLLSKDVKFKDLGLLVIDEEQRFGVQHKEVIKQLKKNVDAVSYTHLDVYKRQV